VSRATSNTARGWRTGDPFSEWPTMRTRPPSGFTSASRAFLVQVNGLAQADLLLRILLAGRLPRLVKP
jgi:hypothetical protein